MYRDRLGQGDAGRRFISAAAGGSDARKCPRAGRAKMGSLLRRLAL